MKKRIAKKMLKNPRQHVVYSYPQLCDAVRTYFIFLRRGEKFSFQFFLLNIARELMEDNAVRIYNLNILTLLR